MHYCLALFTKEIPSKNYIRSLMDKYHEDNVYGEDEDNIVYPQFIWDWYQIGGRYSAQIKLRIDEDDEKYRWRFYSREKRNGRLFWSYTLNELEDFSKNSFMYREEEHYASMGYRDGFLYVDGAKISDIKNMEEVSCFTFLNEDGEAYSREWWNGEEFVKNEDFEEKFKQQMEFSKDMFLTIIDYHD